MRHAIWAFGLLVFTSACGGSTDSNGSGGSSKGGSSSGGSSGGGGGTSSGGGGTSSGGTGATQSGCSPACSDTQYCDYSDNRCGQGAPGSCKPRPQGCDLNLAPVCTCNGTVAGNECGAYSSGSDLNDGANCTPDANQFACGHVFCMIGSQYCRRSTSDIGGEADGFGCGFLPAGCSSPASCNCLANEACGSYCSMDASGNLTLTCPGG